MLILQTPEQVAPYRLLVDKALEAGVPPYAYTDPQRNNNIFASLLRGEMQLWIAYVRTTKEIKAVAIVITTVEEDGCSGVRNLLIYTLYGWSRIPGELYATSIETLKKWARARQCHRVVALTANERILELIEGLGGNSEYRMVTIDV